MKKLALIANKKINPEFVDLLGSPMQLQSHKTIQGYCKANQLGVDPKELKYVLTLIESRLISQFKQLSIIHYRLCELTSNWGKAGEPQAKASFCRHILNIAPDMSLAAAHIEEFNRYIDQQYQENELKEKDLSAVEFLFQNFLVDILGLKFKLHELTKLQTILIFLGSTLFIKSWGFGQTPHFLIGRSKLRHYGPYSAWYVEKELVRSCTIIAALAAINESFNVMIRKESLETIFFQKWMPMVDAGRAPFLYSDGFKYSEGIKQYLLKLWQITSAQTLKKIEPTVIGMMRETVTYHELAHGVIDFEFIGETNSGVINAAKFFDHHAFVPVMEFLAEFAPTHNKIKGPIQNMCDLAKTDSRKATQMYYLYLSDTWFYDTDEAYMYDYTDFMAAMMLKFVKPDKSIDFKALNDEMKIKDLANPRTINEHLIAKTRQFVSELQQIVKSKTFKLKAGDFNFESIRTFALENMASEGVAINESSTSTKILWTRLFNYACIFADSKTQLDNILDHFRLEYRKLFFDTLYGPDVASTYNYDLRDFVFNRLSELGFDPDVVTPS